MGEETEGLMRALIAGGGMAGLMTALALRESGAFTAIDVFEQTRTPSTAGAGLNIPPNAARLARWLGVDLDGRAIRSAGCATPRSDASPQRSTSHERRLCLRAEVGRLPLPRKVETAASAPSAHAAGT